MCPKIGILLLDKRDKTCFQDQISTILEAEFINSSLKDFSESKLNQTKFSNKNLFKLNFKIKFRQPLK